MYGGMKIVLPESTKGIGKTYRLSFKAKGQTTNKLGTCYISYVIGWDDYGMGLPTHPTTNYKYIPENFLSKEWEYFEGYYTVSSNRFMNGTIYLSTT
jgi:hypothetical protein